MSFARFAISAIALLAAACGQSGAPAAGGAQSAAAPVSCDSPAAPLAIGASANGAIPPAQSYPNNARYFCINVPAGTASLTLELSGMSTDLDLYVGHGSIQSVQGVNVEQGDTYEWKANEFGTNPEVVTINAPAAGIYYAEVVSYQGEASSFAFAAR